MRHQYQLFSEKKKNQRPKTPFPAEAQEDVLSQQGIWTSKLQDVSGRGHAAGFISLRELRLVHVLVEPLILMWLVCPLAQCR